MHFDPTINVVDLILRKRNGGSLSQNEIATLVYGYTVGDIPDYQTAAFLMAAFLQGMTDAEMVWMTDAMLNSGRVLDLSDIPGHKVDKHSTGGVGDKVSIPLAPIVAACGVPVPMISGRGLGHTGGTLDKLESIPGFTTSLSIEAYRRQLADIGLVMIGQTDDIAPADRKLYALRDVTGTVEFVPFIAASILSKKLAEGIDALVLDVKFGLGAFMQAEADARYLAETLTQVSERFGKPTVALLTDMDEPLGRAVGNWPEVAESIELLQGGSPDDLKEVTFELAAEMLKAGGAVESVHEGRERAQEAVRSGAAMDQFRYMVQAQGGSLEMVDNPDTRMASACAADVCAPSNAAGYVARIDARDVGRAMVELGAGRKRKEDVVDPLAGCILMKRHGDSVSPGDVLARVTASSEEHLEKTVALIASAYAFDEHPRSPDPRVRDRYADGSWQSGPAQ
ncbi:MAG: thymidine phosphorylase [Bacteroidota bacterium]|nr:thymidine phosphorylase [Bacteroidota bacterium]